MTPRIDAHQHFWTLARGDYAWLTPALGAIHRDFGPAELAPLLARHDIAATVLVQAAPTEAETLFLLDIAARTPFVAGVVGWVALDAPGAPARIAALAADPLLLGLRPMLHDLPAADWILRPALAPALLAMQDSALVLDALVRPPHLPHLLALAARYPGLPLVVDHAAKPPMRGGWDAGWAGDMAALARHPQVCCKISGLLTEAAAGADATVLRPWFEHLLAAFGPQRLLWGSDWPVLGLAASYDHWYAVTQALLAPLDAASRAAILGGTAQRVYLSHRGRSLPC